MERRARRHSPVLSISCAHARAAGGPVWWCAGLALALAGCAHAGTGSAAGRVPAAHDGTAGFGSSQADIAAALHSADPRSLEPLVPLLGRLSPAQFREVAAPALEVCHPDGDRIVCDGQLLGDGDIRDLQSRWPSFGAAQDDPDALGQPQCAPDGERAICIATDTSLGGIQWTFDRREGSWRLVQVLTFPPPA